MNGNSLSITISLVALGTSDWHDNSSIFELCIRTLTCKICWMMTISHWLEVKKLLEHKCKTLHSSLILSRELTSDKHLSYWEILSTSVTNLAIYLWRNLLSQLGDQSHHVPMCKWACHPHSFWRHQTSQLYLWFSRKDLHNVAWSRLGSCAIVQQHFSRYYSYLAHATVPYSPCPAEWRSCDWYVLQRTNTEPPCRFQQ